MWIALEGVDGSGKSSLAWALADELERRYPGDDVEMWHHSQLERPPLDEYELDYQAYRPGQNRHIISDRHAWGELIYGPLYRDGSAVTEAVFRHIELFMLARGARVWHVTQPLDVIQRRLGERGEDYLESHHIEHVWREYTQLTERSAVFADHVSPDGDTSELVETILKAADYYASMAVLLNDFPSYVGKRTPEALLVGEKRGGQPPYAAESAFFPVGGNSGAFLLDSLPTRLWPNIGIVNALEADLPDLLDVLGGPPVVALGRAASDHLLDLDIAHGAVPHPQYVRRFHSKKKSEYGELIADAAKNGTVKLSWPQ